MTDKEILDWIEQQCSEPGQFAIVGRAWPEPPDDNPITLATVNDDQFEGNDLRELVMRAKGGEK